MLRILIGEQEDWGLPSGSSGQEVEAGGPKDEAGFSLVKGSVQGTGHGPGGWGGGGSSCQMPALNHRPLGGWRSYHCPWDVPAPSLDSAECQFLEELHLGTGLFCDN